MNKIWTESEIKILERIYPTGQRKDIEDAFPHRKWSAICTKALKIGLYRDKDEWNIKEEALLKLLYPNTSIKYLVEIFEGRTRGAIQQKALRMGIERNSSFDINIDNIEEHMDNE